PPDLRPTAEGRIRSNRSAAAWVDAAADGDGAGRFPGEQLTNADAHHRLAVGREGQMFRRVVGIVVGALALPGSRAPDADSLPCLAERQRLAVGCQSKATHGLAAGKTLELLARGRVQHADGALLAGGGDLQAVGRPGHARNRALVVDLQPRRGGAELWGDEKIQESEGGETPGHDDTLRNAAGGRAREILSEEGAKVEGKKTVSRKRYENGARSSCRRPAARGTGAVFVGNRRRPRVISSLSPMPPTM